MLLKRNPLILSVVMLAVVRPALAEDAYQPGFINSLFDQAAPAAATGEAETVPDESVVSPEEAEQAGGGCCNDPCYFSRCCSDGWLHRWDECKWVKLGAGLRTSYNVIDEGALNGADTAHDFNLDNMRIYLSGQGHKYIGFEFNTDIRNAQFPEAGSIIGGETGGEVRVLDAVVKFKLTDWVNLWAGRFLPPSDRSNLDGPFYLNAWSFPYVQFGYENIFQGRDDGAALWGQVNDGQFKWQVGLFEGEQVTPQGEDNMQISARVVLNLLDPEPGYYNQSTYYGEKEILAIGVSVFHQDNAHGAVGDTRDYTAWNIDFLYETKLENCAVVTLEAAYYDFDDNDAQAVDPAGDFTDLGRQGESWFVLASYLFPNTVGIGNLEGRFQPYFRYLDYNHDFAPTPGGPFQFNEGWDLGVNYIMEGHNARVTAVFESRDRAAGLSEIDIFRLGAQLQF